MYAMMKNAMLMNGRDVSESIHALLSWRQKLLVCLKLLSRTTILLIWTAVSSLDCDDIQAVAAGYFVHVPPLSKCLHTIHFQWQNLLKTLLFGLDIMFKLAVAKNWSWSQQL
jgi:hypothetical protein